MATTRTTDDDHYDNIVRLVFLVFGSWLILNATTVSDANGKAKQHTCCHVDSTAAAAAADDDDITMIVVSKYEPFRLRMLRKRS